MKVLKKILSGLLLFIFRFYRYAISPFTPASCRHLPTCSNYAAEAVKKHGPFRGTILAARRLSKCHPWGTSGYDPVPDVFIKTGKLKKKDYKA